MMLMNHGKIFELISFRQLLLGKLKELDKEILEQLKMNGINGEILADEAYPLGYKDEEDFFEEEETEESEFGLGGDWWRNN